MIQCGEPGAGGQKNKVQSICPCGHPLANPLVENGAPGPPDLLQLQSSWSLESYSLYGGGSGEVSSGRQRQTQEK